jgi:hypothetical protein
MSNEKVSKTILFAKNMKERLEFAKMHNNWTICDWTKGCFHAIGSPMAKDLRLHF